VKTLHSWRFAGFGDQPHGLDQDVLHAPQIPQRPSAGLVIAVIALFVAL
jgi:hypothetical protein